MMLQLKANLGKISLATEEKIHNVKSSIQKKFQDGDKKKKEDAPPQLLEGNDILEGWTMLAQDKNGRGRSTEVDPETLKDTIPQPSDAAQSPQNPPEQPSATISSTLATVPLEGDTDYVSDDEPSPVIRSVAAPSARASSASPPSEISEHTVGRFGLLSNAIIWNVLSLLEAFDLCQLSRASSQFLKLTTNEFLWERLYIKYFRSNNAKVDKALWYEQEHYGGYRSLYGTKLCEEQLNKTLKSLQNNEHNAVEWLCKPLVSVQNFFSSTDVKILMFGLDGSGKTSILYKLVREERVKTIHTIGFNTESVEHKGYNFAIWDLEHKPQNSFEFWKGYIPGSHGIIFVVDGSAPKQLPQAKATLEMCMAEPRLSGLPVLIYVNKRDAVDSLTALQVVVGLNLHYLCNKSGWHIQPCSTVANDYSLEEGLDWLCQSFQQKEVQRLKTKIVS